jgi:hypothetical protein
MREGKVWFFFCSKLLCSQNELTSVFKSSSVSYLVSAFTYSLVVELCEFADKVRTLISKLVENLVTIFGTHAYSSVKKWAKCKSVN